MDRAFSHPGDKANDQINEKQKRELSILFIFHWLVNANKGSQQAKFWHLFHL